MKADLSVSRVFVRALVMGGVFGAVFFGNLAHAAECGDPSVSKSLGDIEKKIRYSESQLKGEKDNLALVQGNINDMNNFTHGGVVSTMEKTLRVTFFFSSDETKNKVRNFFEDHLLVHGNIDVYGEAGLVKKPVEFDVSNPKEADRALAQIFRDDQDARAKVKSVADRDDKKLHEKLHSDFKEIEEGSHSAKGLNVFQDVTENVADMEAQLAESKATPKVTEDRLARLKALQEQVKTMCIPDMNRVARRLNPASNRSPAVVERSSRSAEEVVTHAASIAQNGDTGSGAAH